MRFGENRRLSDSITGFGLLPVAIALLVLTAGVGPVAGETNASVASAPDDPAAKSGASVAQYTLSGCPETPITRPGVYELTRNVTNSTAGHCIEVNASDVRIDGNGYVLKGLGSGDGRPVHAVNHSQNDGRYGDANDLMNVTVTNLTVADWKKPVTFRRVTYGEVRDSAILGDGEAGIHAVKGSVSVTDTSISNRTNAIEFDSIGKVWVRGNDLTYNERGVVVESPPNSTMISPYNRIENNTIRNNARAGVHVADGAKGTMVFDNAITDNGHSAGPAADANGVTITDSTEVRIRNNTIARNAHSGIEVLETAGWSGGVEETKILDNEIRRNDAHGIRLVDSARDLVANNTVGSNRLDGIVVAHSPEVEIRGNDVFDHPDAKNRTAGLGIRLTNDSVDAVLSNNHVHDNRDGIGVESGSGNASIRDNRIVTNHASGVRVRGSAPAKRIEIRGNVISSNGEFGVRNADSNDIVDATDNWWGDASGPSSAAGASRTLRDPVTGTLADGAGDAVSERRSSGDSNVNFDPWRTARSGSACSDVTTSGYHALNRSVTNSAERYCINVTADDVTLDGMGHTIDGVGGTTLSDGPHPPVGVRVTGENVTITNLTVTDWMTGIVYRNASGFVTDANVTNIDLDGVVVRDATAELHNNDITADDDGIQTTNSTVVVTDTTITNRDDTDLQRGIRANGGSEVTVMGTAIENAAITGILVNTFSEARVRTSTIDDSEVGIEVSSRSAGFVAGSEIRGSDGDGVRIESGSSFDVTLNNLTNVGGSAVVLGPDARANRVQIHDNNVAGVSDYGVSNRNRSAVVNATGNYWGDASGPASNGSDADAPFEDPVSGALADGSGATISEGSTAGVSNVAFDPYETSARDELRATATTTKAIGGTTRTETKETGVETTEGEASTPGFTPVGAVVALLALALLAVRRRE